MTGAPPPQAPILAPGNIPCAACAGSGRVTVSRVDDAREVRVCLTCGGMGSRVVKARVEVKP